MRESYLACFHGGTSGRFILHLMWRIVTGQDYSIKFDESNSAHPETPWFSFYFDLPRSGVDSLSSSRLFHAMKLNEEVSGPYNMDFCHVFPDFDTLRIKAPNTQLVLISYHYNDIVEIVTNRIRKNSVQPYGGKLIYDLLADNVFVKNHYRDLIRRYKVLPERLPEDFFDSAIDEGIKDRVRCYDADLFSEKNLTLDKIPEDFRNKTLVIKYSDIYEKDGGEYTAIRKIENFLQKKTGPLTRRSYETYVANRIKVHKEQYVNILKGTR